MARGGKALRNHAKFAQFAMRREHFTPDFCAIRQGIEKSDDPPERPIHPQLLCHIAAAVPRGIPPVSTKSNLSQTIVSACDPTGAPSIFRADPAPAAGRR